MVSTSVVSVLPTLRGQTVTVTMNCR